MMKSDDRVDVLILGGGLAGLTLALQLRASLPGLSIRVLERRVHPVPEAAFKVGESTVEIGAFYFGDVLGLREHLDDAQIVKFGFRFFFSDGSDRLDQCDELGASVALPTGSWQIDRGRFENFLGERAQALGIDFRCGAVVRDFELAGDDGAHRVCWHEDGRDHVVEARWLVDASGRAGLVKRRLDLSERNGHEANAVWFRMDRRIDPHNWSRDDRWKGRCDPPERWRSTSHLVGDGYWVWLIPLASGSHSVGIVCDAATHPIASMRSWPLALEWMQRHQPQLGAVLAGMADGLQDFAFFRDFSYGCRQVFSPQRWALTGEAGVFLDPFYSPGSDFIAIANTYIVDLVRRDFEGEAWQPYAGVYQQLYFSFYESTLAMYRNQYHLFGDPQVLPLKVLWDYTYYWGVLAALFFAGRIADLPTLSRLRAELGEAKALNASMQDLFGDWGRRNKDSGSASAPQAGRFLDQAAIPWFAELNRGLRDTLDDAGFRARLRCNLERLRQLAAELVDVAEVVHPGQVEEGLRSRLATVERSSLLPAFWLPAGGVQAMPPLTPIT